jgi:FAD:protein FMN transferase
MYDADALSTGIFILGLDKGLLLAESLPGVDAIFTTADYKVYITSGISNNFKITDDEFELVKTGERVP